MIEKVDYFLFIFLVNVYTPLILFFDFYNINVVIIYCALNVIILKCICYIFNERLYRDLHKGGHIHSKKSGFLQVPKKD